MYQKRILVTGAFGCLGAWILRELSQRNINTLATDISDDKYRLRLLMEDEAVDRLVCRNLDITDSKAVTEIVEQEEITHIIHLAGLQVPFCRANPPLGARVNVVGTVNLLEAARQAGEKIQGFAYASSIAVLGPPEYYEEKPISDEVRPAPETLYGVYKVADEMTARVYWLDWSVPSVGLRPYIVYGIGRDQGMTSDLAKATLAAVAGRPYRIKFGGPVVLQYAEDVAKIFVASAESGHQGASALNLRNDVVTVEEFVRTLKEVIPGAEVTCNSHQTLPFPSDLDDSGLEQLLGTIPHTPLGDAIEKTAQGFRELLEGGKVDLAQLES